jgi:hypothetical protein
LREGRWYEYLIRFALRGAATFRRAQAVHPCCRCTPPRGAASPSLLRRRRKRPRSLSAHPGCLAEIFRFVYWSGLGRSRRQLAYEECHPALY